jgi:opacity protein-like surface antigen
MPRELTLRLWLAALAFAALAVGTAEAQVGHDPARSPYQTLRFGQFLGLNGGLLNGNGGALGVAPHHGASLGIRYDILSAGTLSLGVAASVADLERLVVDPRKPIETAVSGPVKQRASIAEAIVQFNVTGGKTWHRIAPYISAGAGIMLSRDTPVDSSGFTFKTRFALTPGLGARIFLADRLFLRVEARTSFWSVSYPDAFRQAPSTDPSKPAVLASPRKEWLANGWYTLGLSYAFSRPF